MNGVLLGQAVPPPAPERLAAVPPRFAKDMMVVADLQNGDATAIEDAVVAAWRMQSDDPRDTVGGSEV